ncbi:unnamed protein product [Vicia faba]|uniref:Uncharacterized protein n=1 Tax=Vicia faba TaxID=3906 RepID=A0AAV0YDR5_VICFA|nr:unnamed protein product [Vicia faba]
MATQMEILNRTHSLLTKSKSTNITIKTISTFPFLNQEPELTKPTPSSLPPNPASGSPLYNENWRNPIPKPPSSNSNAVAPFGLVTRASLSETYDSHTLLNIFDNWMASQ